VNHERHTHGLPDARLVFVDVDFNGFRVAISLGIVAHGFRCAFLIVAVYHQMGGIQPDSSWFFAFILASPRIRQPAVQSKKGDQPPGASLPRNNQLLKPEGARNNRTRTQGGSNSNADQGY
jgi:hypothetical protein